MTCEYCSCTDERACLDPDTQLPCQMVAPGLCSVCAGELYCGWPECPICLERGIVPKASPALEPARYEHEQTGA